MDTAVLQQLTDILVCHTMTVNSVLCQTHNSLVIISSTLPGQKCV